MKARRSRFSVLTAFTLIKFFMGIAVLGADIPETPPVPYNSYNYDMWDNSAPAWPVYQPDRAVNGWDLGVGGFVEPKDLFVDAEGKVYVMDSGNKRVVVLDSSLKLIRVVDTFSFNGQEVELSAPLGFCVGADGLWYIADRGAERVLVCHNDGELVRVIVKPESDLIDPGTKFLPFRVLVDPDGTLYALSFGSYIGAYTFDKSGAFVGFFGSNPVYVNAKLRADRFWRLFATDEQLDRMYRYVPTEYANFAVDREGFIYTVSNFGDNEQRGQVRKLNPLSQNILFAGRKPSLMFFGDWETVYTNRVEKSSLVAVDVDARNFISVLDAERGRVFQYDQSCNLVAIFGGPGDQLGTFKSAVDLVSSGDRILVLDDVKASITAFSPTRYGKALRQAIVLYEDGEYEAALEPWFEALKLDRNNHLTLRGIGRAYERLGRYEEAMDYFHQAQYHYSYSESFREWRTALLRQHFGVFALAFILILVLPFVVGILRRHISRRKSEERVRYISKRRFPFYLVLHPFKGWDELKRERKGSLLYANFILAAWFIASVAEYQFTGFIFNYNRLDQMNLLAILGGTFGIFLFWTLANWAVCTLQEGKGSFKEIWIFSAYSRMTEVLSVVPLIIVSRVLAADEGLFLSMISWGISAWSAIQLAMAIMAVHQYTFKHTIGSLILTIIGILFIVMIIALFMSLFAQLSSFGATIFQEILLRL